jgi:hypothetical protein
VSITLLWVVTGCYAATAWDLYLNDRPGLSLVFVAYALANLGMIWEVHRPS